MRNIIVFLHRWIALVLSVFVVLVSITGAVIILQGPLDRAINPHLLNVAIPASGPVRLSLDSLLASARTRGEVASLALPETEGRAVVVSMARGRDLLLNPYTGEVLGYRNANPPGAAFFRLVHSMHVTLLGGKIGNQVVVWSTVACVFLVLGGIYLWWQDKILRMRLHASWKRINFDLHHLLGISTFLVVLPMTATGAFLHYPVFGRAFLRLDRGNAPAATPQSSPAPGMTTMSIDAAVRTGQAALPGSVVRTISVPMDTKRPISLSLRLPEDRARNGRSRIYVDRWTGAILYVRSTRSDGLGTRMEALQQPLHTGEFYGTLSQVIWFLGCWVLVGQAVTGFLMWWNARPAKKAEAARKRKAAAGAAA